MKEKGILFRFDAIFVSPDVRLMRFPIVLFFSIFFDLIFMAIVGASTVSTDVLVWWASGRRLGSDRIGS